jgi:hypothetical protein
MAETEGILNEAVTVREIERLNIIIVPYQGNPAQQCLQVQAAPDWQPATVDVWLDQAAPGYLYQLCWRKDSDWQCSSPTRQDPLRVQINPNDLLYFEPRYEPPPNETFNQGMVIIAPPGTYVASFTVEGGISPIPGVAVTIESKVGEPPLRA